MRKAVIVIEVNVPDDSSDQMLVAQIGSYAQSMKNAGQSAFKHVGDITCAYGAAAEDVLTCVEKAGEKYEQPAVSANSVGTMLE